MFLETTLTRDRIEQMATRGLWPDDHLYDRFVANASSRGSQTLVVDAGGEMTWGEATGLVDEVSRGLVELGIRSGDVVQIQLPNRREFLLLVLALERIGAIVNPIAPIFRCQRGPCHVQACATSRGRHRRRLQRV